MSGILNAYSGGTYSGLPGAPTIGTATATGSTTATVAFTAPKNTCGLSITGYQVLSSPGSITATGASSPISVTGLTASTSYTFTVRAQNSLGYGAYSGSSNSITTSVAPGSQSYTTSGTYSWVAPTGVTSVSVVAIGGGSAGASSYGGGGGGGGLGYKNNISVSPGSSYTVVVGAGGSTTVHCAAIQIGQNSYFICACNVRGGGGGRGCSSTFRLGGNYMGYTGGYGGCGACAAGGGGGAGGYGNNGGSGGTQNNNGYSGQGSGAGGGGAGRWITGACACLGGAGGGGGVGIYGQGTTGAGGSASTKGGYGGGSGSGGAAGSRGTNSYVCSVYGGCGGPGGAYGGGGGAGINVFVSNGGAGAGGAVRIVWPGNTRTFPSTCVGSP